MSRICIMYVDRHTDVYDVIHYLHHSYLYRYVIRICVMSYTTYASYTSVQISHTDLYNGIRINMSQICHTDVYNAYLYDVIHYICIIHIRTDMSYRYVIQICMMSYTIYVIQMCIMHICMMSYTAYASYIFRTDMSYRHV